MKRIAGLLMLLLLPSMAMAADNALIVTVGSGTTVRSKDVGAGVQAPSSIMVDSSGTFMGAGAFVNYGSTPPAVAVPGVNAFVTNTNPNGQAAMANSSPVTLANNQAVGDPCTFQAKTNVPISTAVGTTALVTGVASKKIYVCSLSLVAAAAVSVSLSEGSSATCGTSNQAAVIGVATNGTAANGVALVANGGLTLGSGSGTVAQTATAANYLCLFQSGTAQLAGNLTYVQQ